MTSESLMRLALREATHAGQQADVPIGAVLVSTQGDVVCGRNLREALGDPTAHAELVALREAARRQGHWRLNGWTCVVTLEPCAMCAGALINARIARLVFGCRDAKAGAVRSLFELVNDPRLNHQIQVEEGVLAQECSDQLRAFFQQRRRTQQSK